MKLTPRLALAARLSAGGKRILDIGCDHAYLSIALVQGGAEHAYASDLRPGPLSAARANIAALGLESRITPVLSHGLEAFGPEDGDTVVLCGMGGELMVQILESAPWALTGAHSLVCQPMTHGDVLRRFLASQGCVIEAEALAREGGRLYTVLRARGGSAPYPTENFGLFTHLLLSDPAFPAFLQREKRRFSQALAGKRAAGLPTGSEEAILARLEECSHGA